MIRLILLVKEIKVRKFYVFMMDLMNMKGASLKISLKNGSMIRKYVVDMKKLSLL
jgi:hypothetical protein